MSQRDIVVGALLSGGTRGVDNHDLIYQMGITRAAAIIHELREEGFDIETVEGRAVADGRVALCTYVLRRQPTTAPAAAPTPAKVRLVPAESLTPLPDPAALKLPCGCIRAADGRSWEERCGRHEAKVVVER